MGARIGYSSSTNMIGKYRITPTSLPATWRQILPTKKLSTSFISIELVKQFWLIAYKIYVTNYVPLTILTLEQNSIPSLVLVALRDSANHKYLKIPTKLSMNSLAVTLAARCDFVTRSFVVVYKRSVFPSRLYRIIWKRQRTLTRLMIWDLFIWSLLI